ncbi:MAG: methyltransferase type 11 [Euryarchaeota archaeon]|jgi:ubiquinone/menaquinone biosynthesis C-methylase UbiE|nr:methyltransferase type 11 [Euryarchaeota archaeon]|tara:strand:- start:2903 stop:3742 length:840 start_codon:yes stop_codon:yes gene_type:complete
MESLGEKMSMGIPARIFATILKYSPASVQNRLWKWWYQRISKAHNKVDFRFMNYGFVDEDGPVLDLVDEPYRLFIQLYHMNIRDVDLNNKQVLEVGSGRGGGASWIAKSKSPSSLIGVDFSKEAVTLCNDWYEQENLNFIEGNAQDLPFDADSFDIVYNVESSHCYGDINKFVSEVFRVLRKDGYFCWTDFRDEETMKKTEEIFQNVGFSVASKKEITDEVVDALDMINDAKKERITELVPRTIRRSFETFAGVQGTPVYDSFKSGKLKYYRYQMVKKN